MKEWKWRLVNGCECKSPLSTATQFVNPCQDGTNASMCSGNVLKIMILQWNKLIYTFKDGMDFHLICMTKGILLIEQLSYIRTQQLSMDPAPIQLKPIHTLTSCYSIIHFDIILSFTSRGPYPMRFQDQNCTIFYISHFLHVCYMSSLLTLSRWNFF
jgi:hypothetical protein